MPTIINLDKHWNRVNLDIYTFRPHLSPLSTIQATKKTGIFCSLFSVDTGDNESPCLRKDNRTEAPLFTDTAKQDPTHCKTGLPVATQQLHCFHGA